ncbi:hypothetical protein BC777_2709 [Yoonia maricola]|uniref:Uncharacterized protein n=1 Tax=Yoonia maricola TaxID=420999 RepID=A0A2M8W5Z4_9RHOB|nr:hypothetical protein BC777_2709 [Yoonia maricola]
MMLRFEERSAFRIQLTAINTKFWFGSGTVFLTE